LQAGTFSPSLHRQRRRDDRDGVVGTGFRPGRGHLLKKIVADYEKASGNTIDHTITTYAPLRQKIVAAMTSGVVPDLFQNTPPEIIAALRLAGQAGGRERGRRDATGGIHRYRAAHGPLLQQCREEAQLLRCALLPSALR